MAKQTTGPSFDVRHGIREADLDDESIQLVYDAINRMVVLIGDIPFERLFLAPVHEIASHVTPRLDNAARYGLLREPVLVKQLVRELGEREGKATIASFFVRSRDEVKPETSLILRKLRRHGVRVPLPISDRSKQESRQRVVDELVRANPEGTFKSLFDPKGAQPTSEARKAIQRARLLGLFNWWVNDRCCTCEIDPGTKLPTSCDCDTVAKGKFCLVTDQGVCTAASDKCP